MFGIGRCLKSGDVVRRNFDRFEKTFDYGLGNFARFGRHRAVKRDGVEINHDAIAVIASAKPIAFGLFLGA